jgi:hypothetical protein
MYEMSEFPWKADGRPLFVNFFAALRHPCPLPHGSTISRLNNTKIEGFSGTTQISEDLPVFQTGDSPRGFESLKFWQAKERVPESEDPHLDILSKVIADVTGKQVPDGYGFTLDEVDSFRTVVEMASVVNSREIEEFGYQAIRNAFDRCFDLLTEVSLSSRLVAAKANPLVAREHLHFVLWFGRWGDEFSYGEVGGLLLGNPPKAPLEATFDGDQMEHLHAILGRLWSGSPIEILMDRAVEARRNLFTEGDYANAVIQMALSSEVLLDSLLGVLVWEEQQGAEDIDAARRIFDDTRGGLAARVRREYAPRIGGTWDVSISGPVRNWSIHLAKLRGRIVHRGYRPSSDEAEAAMLAADGLLDFIKSRLASSARRFPRAALMFCGEPGLKRLGGWRAAQKHLQESTDPNSWFSEYSAWRSRVDVASL